MFEEAQYFAPVAANEDGSVTVQLAASHPGFADPVYRARRNAIAALAVGHTKGDPIPHAEYTDEEHEVWALVTRELAAKHHKYAVTEFVNAAEELGLPTDHIPQLEEVSDLLTPLTGFRYLPAAGLVPLREFYGVLADGYFHSTQYIRHHSVPFYTPEPDIIHEVIGHGNTLASRRFADLYRVAGRAAQHVETEEALEFVSKIFWFTLEFGVMNENNELKAYGAGILSSYGEIEEFRGMDIRPLDLAAMGATEYDITKYQDVLFAAASLNHLEDVVGSFWATCDDDMIDKLRA
ncbi:phenylalanine 4-monooxygenase [Acrocarpospora macrocephala]|uniref:Phenylalanine 4-monooxygenase n=1 Tax=Acrocarpospora macrocephala TaxID=150177 RepID=A0A5M3WSW4_9ACTN|nr:phenylalanine 4-monooxygenase [Acrocarpospora macrocephala]GES11596.1 phenylalanine 4-monooxygenase [Acrocarpospora macrocephala]